MRLKTLPLAKQISLASAALVALIVLSLVGSAAWLMSKEAMDSAKRTVAGQADNLRRSLEIAYQLSEESSTRLADLFESRFNGSLTVNTAETVNLGGKDIPSVYLNGRQLTGNFAKWQKVEICS